MWSSWRPSADCNPPPAEKDIASSRKPILAVFLPLKIVRQDCGSRFARSLLFLRSRRSDIGHSYPLLPSFWRHRRPALQVPLSGTHCSASVRERDLGFLARPRLQPRSCEPLYWNSEGKTSAAQTRKDDQLRSSGPRSFARRYQRESAQTLFDSMKSPTRSDSGI
jgi:hypothetical protein